MEFSEVIKARRSTRQFTDEPVSAGQIMKLVNAAISAPNACNMQSWHFYVVTEKAVKQKFCDEKVFAPWATTAPVIFVVCTDAKEITARFGDRAEVFTVQDTAAAVENILLTATDLGLGGCFMGAFDRDKIRSVLNIPENRKPVAVVPIGKPALTLPARPRNPIEQAVTFVGNTDGAEYRQVKTEFRRYEVKNSKLPGAAFENLDLSDSAFDKVQFDGTVFRKCEFKNVKFENCNLDSAEVDGKKIKQ